MLSSANQARWTKPDLDTYVMHRDGTHVHKVSEIPVDGASPDGRWLAGISHGDVYLFSPNGKKTRRLTRGHAAHDFDPSFSPNGRLVVFTRQWATNRYLPGKSIILVRLNGSKVRRVNFPSRVTGPVFSPYGRWIAYSHRQRGSGINISAFLVRNPLKRRVITDVSGAGSGSRPAAHFKGPSRQGDTDHKGES